MNTWNYKGIKRNKRSTFTVIMFSIFVVIVIIVTFLLAAQLVLFPSKGHNSVTKEPNMTLQPKVNNESDNQDFHTDITSVQDPFLPSGDTNTAYDNGVKPEPSLGLLNQVQASSNDGLQRTASPTPVLKKSNSGPVNVVANKVPVGKRGTNGKYSPSNPASTSKDKLIQPKMSGKAEIGKTNRMKETITGTGIDSNNEELESPPQEIKKSMTLPTAEKNKRFDIDESQTTDEVGKKITYMTKKNETVNTIAAKFGVTTETICQENGLPVSDGQLSEGQSLSITIPGNRIYRMKLKETLWRIAQRYGTTVALLQDINNINDITKIKAGELIILPVPIEKVVNKKF